MYVVCVATKTALWFRRSLPGLEHIKVDYTRMCEELGKVIDSKRIYNISEQTTFCKLSMYFEKTTHSYAFLYNTIMISIPI